MSTKKIGRPKKKPEYDREKTMQVLLNKAVELLDEPIDDRDVRDPAAPSLRYVAAELHTTIIRARKLLITADYYSTEISRNVQRLHHGGLSIAQIAQKTGLSEASVYSYLPYSKGIYNLEERTLNAERGRLFKKRKEACKQMQEHIDQPDALTCMWSAILAFQGYPFVTAQAHPFKYTVMDGEMVFSKNEKSIPKSTVETAFCNARKTQASDGCVNSPQKLGTFGASYLYPVFLRIGICERSKEGADNAGDSKNE